MKQQFFLILFLLLALLLPAPATAYDFELDGIYYELWSYSDENDIMVTAVAVCSGYNPYTGDVIIPDSISYSGTTYPVKWIYNDAFSNCSELTSITIPNTVIEILSYAFYGCNGLTSVTIPNSVTYIGECAFNNCRSLTTVTIGNSVSYIEYDAFSDCNGITDLVWNARNCSSKGDMTTSNIERVTIGDEVEVLPDYFVSGSKITSVTIPNSVTTIGYSAFNNCNNLIVVTMGNSVSSISNYAFYSCDGLTSIELPECVTTIGDYAFSDCISLTSIDIPNSVTTIGYSAFRNCGSLTNVTIGDSVASIGNYAFQNCSGLASLTIGKAVSSTGSDAFSGCSGITDLVWNARNCSSNGNMTTSNIERVTIGDEVEVLPSSFVSGSKITSVIIPDSVTTIGSNAFQNCSGLTTVAIGNSVSSIGSYAFSGCSSLMSIVLPNSLNLIENSLFGDCYSLAGLSIPSSVTSIGSSAFKNCYGLTSITIPNSVTTIGNSAFSYCEGLTSITIPNSVTTIGSNAFYGCYNLACLTIGKSVASIGSQAFYYCSSLRNIVFNAENCTSIEGVAFYNYYYNYLSSLQFGDGVEHIPAGLPSFDMSGKTLVLPNSVKTIDAGAINGYCDAVIIGTGVENIAAESFYEGISVAYVSTTDPQPCEPGAFYDPQILYVPAGCKNKYFTVPGWSEFAYIIEGEYAVADSIMLDNTELSIYRDATAQLNATILPDTASATTTGWYSMNEYIATVDNNGVVTANAVGETDIVAWVDNVATSCHVIVTPVLVENIILSENHLSMAINDMYSLSVTAVTPDNAEVKELEWDIPENDVITTQLVNNSRLNISAEKEGRVTITVHATDGSGRSASCEVFVSSTTPVKTLTITPETLDLHVGYSQQLTAIITPEDAYTKTLQWMTSNSNVAYVNSNGVVTAYGVGNATITAITTDGSNLSATCAVSVTTVPVESVTLNRTELEMNEGSSYTLSATVLPSDAYNRSLTWTSSNPRVATVNSNGRVTAIGIGSTIVTATTNDGTNISAACHVTVKSQMANDCFVIPDTEVLYGESVVIPVRLNNVRSFMAFQTDIFLPEGFKVAKDDNGKYIVTPSSRMTSDHVIMTQDVSNGAVRVICYTPIGSAFTGGSGTDLFYITVTAPDDAGGDYSINLRNSRLTTANYTEVTIPDAGAVIKVKTFIPGDVNNSHTVTVTDIVVTAQYILEMNPDPFVFEAADMNGDGNITVTDIMLIVQKIMNPSMYNAPKRMPALINVDDRMSSEDVSLMAGETRTVTIALDNTLDYSAFQLDLTLPEGLTASNFTLTDRAGSHLLNVNTLGDVSV